MPKAANWTEITSNRFSKTMLMNRYRAGKVYWSWVLSSCSELSIPQLLVKWSANFNQRSILFIWTQPHMLLIQYLTESDSHFLNFDLIYSFFHYHRSAVKPIKYDGTIIIQHTSFTCIDASRYISWRALKVNFVQKSVTEYLVKVFEKIKPNSSWRVMTVCSAI